MKRILFFALALAFLSTPILALTKGTAHAATTTTKYLNGKIVYDSNKDGNYAVYTMDADGSNQMKITNTAALDANASWSPDGTKIVYNKNDGTNWWAMWTMNADGSNQTRLTTDTQKNMFPAWSPDGTKIVYTREGSGVPQVYTVNADGGSATNLSNNSSFESSPAWSPDGTKIALWSNRSGDGIYVMNADGSNASRIYTSPTYSDFPAWSPDGHTIAFSTQDQSSGLYRINTMDPDGGNVKQLTTDGDAEYSAWSPDGKKLLFLSYATNCDIYTMDADGSNIQKLNQTSDCYETYNQGWQRLPYTQTVNDDGSLTSMISSDKDYSAGEYTIADKETLNLDGKLGHVTVNSGGTLEGTGEITKTLTVNTGGVIAPGHSPGCLSSGDLVLNGTYQAQIGGTTACTGYDQLKVTGTVNLAGSTLTPSLVNGFVPKVGDSFTLIDNDSTDAVTGTFTGLAEGSTFTSQGVTYKVSYVGGTGNDVVLTVTSINTAQLPKAPNTGFKLITSNPAVILIITLATTCVLLMSSKASRNER